MRLLSSALQQATRAGTAAPEVRLELMDLVPHYAPVFVGGPSGSGTAVLAADGAVVQAYHDGTRTVYARRVADPTAPSWGAWAAVTASAAPGAGVALAGLADRLRLLWQDTATTMIYAADSFDGGVSWGAGAPLFDPGAALGGIAADGDAGTVFVAYATAGGAQRVAVWALAGTWHGADWMGGDAHAIAGLGAVRNADASYLVAVAAQASASAGTALQACAYGGTWSTPTTVVPADIGAGVSLADPRLSWYDGRYHLTYAVVDSGAVSGIAAARAAVTHSLDGAHWTAPLEDATPFARGATALKHAQGYLLAAPDAATLAPPYTGSAAQYRDISSDVVRLEVVQQDGAPARLVVTLANDAAQYAGAGGPVLPALRPNAALRLSWGYTGAAVVPAYLFYIEDWSRTRTAGEDEVVITAADALSWLDRQSRTLLAYTGQTVGWLAREIAARAGVLAVSIPATAQFSYTVPTFAIPAGALWRAALARLGRAYGFDVAARTAADGTDLLMLYEKGASDAPVWSYGDEVEQVVTAVDVDRANHVLVFGATAPGGPPVGEAWDWADVAATGQERYLHTVEPLITTRAGAATRAALELVREGRDGQSGSLSAPLHPGLEVWDVVALDGGGASTALRVATLHAIYEPHPGTYDVVLTLEGV